ncbi:5'-methylthioadenosine/S-adenosylhomocysteine nucleosidase [Virgibacillus soli]
MTIGIIGAMDEEIALLQSEMIDNKEETVANCLFICGKLKGKDIVLLKSGIGKVNAAMATTIMHERYAPQQVINTGSAGGFSTELNIGDIVISTTIVHHDVDATAFDYAYGQVPNMPAVYEADAKLMKQAGEAAAKLSVKVVNGMIATGDSFMDNPERVAFARNKFPEMKAAEMEAAAIAQVCYQYNTPFVIIRSLSDIAGKQSSTSFDEFLEIAATNAATLIINMIENY